MIKSFMITVIFYLYVFISDGVNTFAPSSRAEQAAILVNTSNKIYFYGGITEGTQNSDFFYLDVSSSFVINDMPWYDITPTTGLPIRVGSTACTYGENKNKILYIGGSFNVGHNFTIVYDTTTQQWNTPKMSMNFTTYRSFTQCVVLNNDVYFYGGAKNITNMTILDTSNLNWTELSAGPLTSPPIGVQGYSATLLNNTSILYIGGQPGGEVLTLPYSSFNQI